jgi:ligand-binding sensor domain-containing protein
MVVDRSGNLWFGGQEGAFRYDGKTLATFTSKEGLLDDFVGSMIIDRAGNLWFGHPGSFPDGKGGGASRYDGKSLKRFTQKEGLSSLTVYCMLEDKAGNIWFGSADAGACRYDGKTFTNFSATNPPRLPARPAQAPANDQTSAIAKGEAVSAGISQMRAVRLHGPFPRVIPRRIGIEPITPLKRIPAQVTS